MTVTETNRAPARPGGAAVLEATGVTMRFGGLLAVNDVNLTVHEGEIVGLIGPNGAGKTTFFNCLTGLYKPTSGQVRFAGAPRKPPRAPKRRKDGTVGVEAVPVQPLAALTPLPPKPRAVVRAGMARTFQNIRLFANMTALENRSSVARKRPVGRGARNCSSSSVSAGRPSTWPGTCRTATSAGSRSRGRWPPTRSSSCWTSRRPV
jgi:ABC-type branched-subunit amino acid transport system ATPase component